MLSWRRDAQHGAGRGGGQGAGGGWKCQHGQPHRRPESLTESRMAALSSSSSLLTELSASTCSPAAGTMTRPPPRGRCTFGVRDTTSPTLTFSHADLKTAPKMCRWQRQNAVQQLRSVCLQGACAVQAPESLQCSCLSQGRIFTSITLPVRA